MYVPIIIDPCFFYEYRYLWVYLMYEYHCFQNNWPLITEECYRDYKMKRPVSNVYEAEFCNLHQYRVLEEQEANKVKKYYISSDILENLAKKCGSKQGARLYLLQNRYKPLEKEIKRLLYQIWRDTGIKPKGILNWNAHFVSVRYVANKMKIPVITNEFALRFPEYFPLGYFCKGDIYETKEIDVMYKQFQKNKTSFSYPLLRRKEILALLLDKSRLEILERLEIELPNYEIGIAGCHPFIPTLFAKSSYTDLELIEDVRAQYAETDILFRKHPGDEPYQADYTLLNNDTSQYASDFILDCKRITAIGSNAILEALLLGKIVYTNSVSPFSLFCLDSLEDKEGHPVDDDVLNFILFGYLVPYNKMFDTNFMSFRIKESNICHIIESNMVHCFEEQGVPSDVLHLTQNRYEEILKYRKEKNDE